MRICEEKVKHICVVYDSEGLTQGYQPKVPNLLLLNIAKLPLIP